MKKTISLLLAFMLCLSLCACGSASGNETGESKTRTISIGEKVTVGEFAFTVTSVKFDDKATIRGQKWVAGDDEQFCIIYCTIYNNSRKKTSADESIRFTLNYDNGYENHYFRPEWQYGTSSWVTPEISPQESLPTQWYADVPNIQADDKASPMVLQIKFMGEEFQLIVR